jgi:dGTPase
VVKFADTIAYIGRDLQDAVEINLLSSMDDIPGECRAVLGETNREIINTLINDLLENSDTEITGCISYGREVEHALAYLRKFSREHIYENPKLTAEREKIRYMYQALFLQYLRDIEHETEESPIYREFLDSDWLSPAYRNSALPAELVRDYLAGMTDRYFEARFRDSILPRTIEGRFR